MKSIVALFALLCAGIASAQTTDTTTTPPKKTAKSAAAKKKATTKTAAAKTAAAAPPTVQPLTIPTDAIAKPDGTYSYTDKAGQKWTYSKTPFGVSKIQDLGENAPEPFVTTPKAQLIKATDNGETVKFERQTPFGVTHWEKKKSDLTDQERQIFESQQARTAPSQPE